MTHEILKQANELNHAITDTEAQISIIEEILHSDYSLQLRADVIGSITLDDSTKLDVIDIVLNRLNARRDKLEDALRML